MDPLKVSAQFAAFKWYCDSNPDHPDAAGEAARFSGENWVAFLPAASERLGEILVKLAARREATIRRRRRRRAARLDRTVP